MPVDLNRSLNLLSLLNLAAICSQFYLRLCKYSGDLVRTGKIRRPFESGRFVNFSSLK